MMNLTRQQSEVMDAAGHVLVIGGPGSGKTTVSILKAAKIGEEKLYKGQKILFLSFARATIARVREALEENTEINKEVKKNIIIETYHSFFWNIIKSHGYLLGLPRKLNVLDISAEAVALSEIRNKYKNLSALSETEKDELHEKCKCKLKEIAQNEGKLCFDLFAEYSASILKSNKIKNLISDCFPYIILDEFQDTDNNEWNFVKTIGQSSELIALADPDQRIYDFRKNTSPDRINHFLQEFNSQKYNLLNCNHRSSGTDIAIFGNNILSGKFKNQYSGIFITRYAHRCKEQPYAKLKSETLAAIQRLNESRNKNWSIVIIVPTKKMIRLVSDNFNESQEELPEINHHAVIDLQGAILAGKIIAFLLQSISSDADEELFIHLVCNFFRGKGGGSKPNKGDIEAANTIERDYMSYMDKGKIRQNSITNKMLLIYKDIRNLNLLGNPWDDWLNIIKHIEGKTDTRFDAIASEARNIRIFRRGTELSEALSENWRNFGAYKDALSIFENAFMKENFSISTKPETGVIIMNMHKVKGKQFDEVIIFENFPPRRFSRWQSDRIVRNNSWNEDLSYFRKVLHVCVTRAKNRTTIMTPVGNPCILLPTNS